MRNPLRFAFAATLALAVFALAADKATIADVLKDPDKFDGKAIIVTGKVTKFKAKTSKAGNPYYNFKLVGKKDEDLLSVYGRGTLAKEPEDDSMVEVTGIFTKEKKVGALTFKNEIDVTKNDDDKKTKDFGIKPIKKAGS